MIPQPDFLVRVSCMTYNHAPHIVDALNGFTMQETTFPFVCTVIDDASTDGEQEVIKAYLQEHFDLEDKSIARNEETDDYVLTFARHKTNQNCFFAVLYLKYNHYSLKKSKQPYIQEWSNTKYVALCEGDDYWIDKLKLQKQVTFLENNPSFIICFHNFYVKDERINKNAKLDEYYKSIPFADQYGVKGFVFGKEDYWNYWNCWYTQPLAMVMRNGDFYKNIPKSKYKYYRDHVEYYYVLCQGKGMLLQEIMGVYRMNNGGIYAGKTNYYNKLVLFDNLRTMYLLEKDKTILPALFRNTIDLIKYAADEFKIIQIINVCINYYIIVPWSEKIRFTYQLLWEIYINIKRKIRL